VKGRCESKAWARTAWLSRPAAITLLRVMCAKLSRCRVRLMWLSKLEFEDEFVTCTTHTAAPSVRRVHGKQWRARALCDPWFGTRLRREALGLSGLCVLRSPGATLRWSVGTSPDGCTVGTSPAAIDTRRTVEPERGREDPCAAVEAVR
jgi:hypothetical protein